MPETKKNKKNSHPIIRFIKFRILHVDDSPQSLALGVAIGLFTAWTPLIGLHMLIALLLSILFKANKFLSITFVWVSNIFTFVPIYLPAYLLGRAITSLFGYSNNASKDEVMDMLTKLSSFRVFIDIWSAEFWQQLAQLFIKIGFPLFVGSIILGLLIANIAYFTTYRLISWYRKKNPRRRHKKYL